MAEFLLRLVTEFAGPIVDLLISSLGWNKAERTHLQQLKKQLLEIINNTIEFLTTGSPETQTTAQMSKQWNELAVDFEPFHPLNKRIEEFAEAIDDSTAWNEHQKRALAIRLSAFKASIRKTSASDFKKLGKTDRRQKRRQGRTIGKKPAPAKIKERKISKQKKRKTLQ